MSDFRERLKIVVKERYGNYTRFVEKIGIHLSYFSRILSGERTPSYTFFKKLADLGFDLNYLFKGEESSKYVVKEKEIPYKFDTKIETLKNLVYRIDNLFEELNQQEIDLNMPKTSILTKQLIEFIELLKKLAHLVDETLIENQELMEKLLHSEPSQSLPYWEEMKNQTTHLISRLSEELKQHGSDSNSLN